VAAPAPAAPTAIAPAEPDPVVVEPPPSLPVATESGPTSTPGRTPRIPHAPTSADRDRYAVRKAIRQTMKPIVGCYERLSPANRRRVVIKFTIGPDGTVQSSKASGPQGELENCIAEAFANTKFEKPVDGGTLTITYPLNFRPG
jgi:outer membrane biosynthesis protein TonB